MLGMGQAVAAVYRRVEEFFGAEEAEHVACAFVGDDGGYVFEPRSCAEAHTPSSDNGASTPYSHKEGYMELKAA